MSNYIEVIADEIIKELEAVVCRESSPLDDENFVIHTRKDFFERVLNVVKQQRSQIITLSTKNEDHSKMIELPCNINDTVYSIKNGDIRPCIVKWIKIAYPTTLIIRLNTDYYTFFDVTRKDFCKTIFLRKEEAEQALVERCKSDEYYNRNN